MNLELLRAFVTLGEVCNFSEAAAHLGISQPTLSKQIRRLEDVLGAQLFTRSRQGTELTEFGMLYLAEVQPVVRDASQVWETGMRLARGESGELSIGFTFSAVDMMTRTIVQYRRSYPEVKLGFHVLTSQTQIPMLRDKQLDIAFARWPGAPDLESRLVAQDRLAFVYPAALSDQIESIDSPLVHERPFIRLERSVAPGFESYVDRLFAWKGLMPNVTHWVNESLIQLRMVSSGLGVAVMHESGLRGVIDTSNIVIEPIDGPGLSWQVGMFWRKDEARPTVRRFIAMANETMNFSPPAP